MHTNIIVATRPSKLAYTQTLHSVLLLKRFYPNFNFIIKKLSTKGDRIKQPLTAYWGTGVFVKELEQALLHMEADLAVHSVKDMPAKQTEGLVFAAFPKREDARDLILQRHIKLPKKMVIGTDSPRRRLQIRNLYNNVLFKSIRGNIDSRIKKLENKQYDAIILAAAGLNRLGLIFDKNQLLSLQQCLPAVGQGALAVQARKNDKKLINIARKINHQPTEKAIYAERIFLEYVQGGCTFPLAAYAQCYNNSLQLDILIGDLKKNISVRESIQLPTNFTKSEIINFTKILIKKSKNKGINL